MSCLRRLAISAGIVSLLAISSCGLNPQPEPPSADESGETPSEPDGGASTPPPGQGPPVFAIDAAAPTEPDASFTHDTDLHTDKSGNRSANPGLVLPDPEVPDDAGAETDADADAAVTLTPDSGVLTL